jgi:hypothetical protein
MERGTLNRVLKKVFRPKTEEDRSYRKLHNDELHSLHSSPNIVRVIKSRRMRWAGHVARMGEVSTEFWLEGPKVRDHWEDTRRWEDNIKMDLREIGICGANCTQLAQDRVRWRACMNTVMNLRVP